MASRTAGFDAAPSGRQAVCWAAAISWLLLFVLWAVPSALAQTPDLRVTAAVESQEVYVGAPFTLQIQVEGSDEVERPDLSGLEDFRVQEGGGGQNNSQSISIVNGKMSRIVQRGYNFNYRLTAKRAGDLTIPSITVKAGGQVRRTQQITIRALPPAENENFKLRVELSEQHCYVGQPVVMTVTWYIGKNVEDFEFNVPVLSDKRFEVAGLDPGVDPAHQDSYLRVPLGSDAAIGRKTRATLDGREFLAVRFEKVLIPKQAGAIHLPQSTVSLRAIQGYQRRGGNSMFDDFFSDGVFGRRAVYEDFVVPSNTPALEVQELPTEGRPAGFAGLVGSYEIEADASPTNVSVGDPITVTLRVKGPRYLDNVSLPALEKQPSVARDFRVPEERATGVVKDGAKVFTQTLRATHSGVDGIPPIELPYFDPKTGHYEIARTQPIALKVEGNRIITAQDAEGRDSGAVMQTELEAQQDGIAHNYDGAEVLVDQSGSLSSWLGSPLGLALLVVPPMSFCGLWAFTLLASRRGADPRGRRARRAYREFNRRLEALRASPGQNGDGRNVDSFHSRLLDALRAYLGARLGLAPGALTFADVAAVLAERGAGDDTVAEFRRLFEQCEAGRYAGGSQADDDPSQMIERARQASDQLERTLR